MKFKRFFLFSKLLFFTKVRLLISVCWGDSRKRSTLSWTSSIFRCYQVRPSYQQMSYGHSRRYGRVHALIKLFSNQKLFEQVASFWRLYSSKGAALRSLENYFCEVASSRAWKCNSSSQLVNQNWKCRQEDPEFRSKYFQQYSSKISDRNSESTCTVVFRDIQCSASLPHFRLVIEENSAFVEWVAMKELKCDRVFRSFLQFSAEKLPKAIPPANNSVILIQPNQIPGPNVILGFSLQRGHSSKLNFHFKLASDPLTVFCHSGYGKTAFLKDLNCSPGHSYTAKDSAHTNQST